ncbi:endonuclease VII domain-containing protein [Streptomyces sp. SID3343]|uniref:endonuclease VII domain-containing protein n=1 Tax=Streptomyces sp. SID3343 TaxID=2690260 RepID=UPI001367C08C|nr:endonuclease VII domain-containing protein [Streptomyces sp. SID3343]MYV97363.1 recombination endonuclease VII [Streptomyces sp. SID3343]
MSDLKSGKNCPDCTEWKPVGEYGKNASNPDGLSFYCLVCNRRRSAESYRARRERAGFKLRPKVDVPDGYKRCPKCEQIKPYAEWHKSSRQYDGLAARCKPCRKAEGRAGYFMRTYGLTEDDVRRMVTDQMGVCPICQSTKLKHVDHDHETGRVRAVLCFNCNAALGMFKDRPDALRRAATYVEGIVWKPTLVAPGVYRLPS